jgi:hypothetical protein
MMKPLVVCVTRQAELARQPVSASRSKEMIRYDCDFVFRHCEKRLRRSNPVFVGQKTGLLRFARNDGAAAWSQTITGQTTALPCGQV